MSDELKLPLPRHGLDPYTTDVAILEAAYAKVCAERDNLRHRLEIREHELSDLEAERDRLIEHCNEMRHALNKAEADHARLEEAVAACFVPICDEPGCTTEASTISQMKDGGYRQACYKHADIEI